MASDRSTTAAGPVRNSFRSSEAMSLPGVKKWISPSRCVPRWLEWVRSWPLELLSQTVLLAGVFDANVMSDERWASRGVLPRLVGCADPDSARANNTDREELDGQDLLRAYVPDPTVPTPFNARPRLGAGRLDTRPEPRYIDLRSAPRCRPPPSRRCAWGCHNCCWSHHRQRSRHRYHSRPSIGS